MYKSTHKIARNPPAGILGNLEAESLRHNINTQLDFHKLTLNTLRILTGTRHIQALKSPEVELPFILCWQTPNCSKHINRTAKSCCSPSFLSSIFRFVVFFPNFSRITSLVLLLVSLLLKKTSHFVVVFHEASALKLLFI